MTEPHKELEGAGSELADMVGTGPASLIANFIVDKEHPCPICKRCEGHIGGWPCEHVYRTPEGRLLAGNGMTVEMFADMGICLEVVS